MKYIIRVALLAILFATPGVRGQEPRESATAAKTPQELAAHVLQAFTSGTAEQFNNLIPEPGAQDVVARAITTKAVRHGDVGKVIWQGPNRAVLLLTGTVPSRNSGDETVRSRTFSGIYEAQATGGDWKVSRHIPIDEGNHITSHAVTATIVPGEHIDVADQVGIEVGSKYGFAVRLNDRADLKQVELDGHAVHYEFGGGVLWIEMPSRPHARLSITYTILVDKRTQNERPASPAPISTPADSIPASADAHPIFGDFLNTDVWMPLFDYDSANGTAPISITAKIPAEYYLTTSIPQTETVSDGVRIVKGQTDEPEFILSLVFDRDWHPTLAKVGDIIFETFLTPDFHWTSEKLQAVLQKVYQFMDPRFGPPHSHYLAVAEDRGVGESGFRFRTNDLVVSGQGGGKSKTLIPDRDQAAASPSVPFPHEVSHGWTMQASGQAANTLREGWATYSEWSFLGNEYGPVIGKEIWETGRNDYMLGQHNGARSIFGNPGNGSIHYTKGAEILHMLDELMGSKAFDQGMREFIDIPRDKPAGYEQFIAAMSHAEGHDMTSFIMPWLTGKYIPDIEARVEGSQVIVSQTQPDVVFNFPLKLALKTDSGKDIIQTIQLSDRTNSLDVSGIGTVTSVRIDPDHEFLIQRHFGETVHFELRAPDAKTVALQGTFTVKPVPAARNGDVWTLDLPMSEGRYCWTWMVDGKPLDSESSEYNGQSASGARLVQPVVPVEAAYPK
jgi:hypothetical protein